MDLRRLLACTLVPLALTAWAPSPAPSPPAGAAADRVYALAGTWSCRSADGAIMHSTGMRDGNTITVHDVIDQDGKQTSFNERYTFDPVKQTWHLVSGMAGGIKADAATWVADRWTVEGADVNAIARRTTLDLLPDGDFRRMSYYENGAKVFVLDSVERCTPGTTPPAANACIAENYPATTLVPGVVNARLVPRVPSPAVVYVIVSLNERSELVGARVQASPSEAFNASALGAARDSKFRTKIVNCKPVAADYVFSVTFNSE